MSDKRLTAALAKLDLDNDAEALTALRFATKLLKARGLDWVKVAEKVTGRSLGDVMAPDGAQRLANDVTGMAGFGDIFKDIFGDTPFAHKAAEPARQEAPRRSRRPQSYRTGAEIPAHLYGTVVIDDQGVWKGRDTLVVTITSADGMISYGPMKVFDAQVVASLREAAQAHDPRIVTVSVRQPAQSHHYPVINQASVDGNARAM